MSPIDDYGLICAALVEKAGYKARRIAAHMTTSGTIQCLIWIYDYPWYPMPTEQIYKQQQPVVRFTLFAEPLDPRDGPATHIEDEATLIRKIQEALLVPYGNVSVRLR